MQAEEREYEVRIDYSSGEFDIVVIDAYSIREALVEALRQNLDAVAAQVLVAKVKTPIAPLVTFAGAVA